MEDKELDQMLKKALIPNIKTMKRRLDLKWRIVL